MRNPEELGKLIFEETDERACLVAYDIFYHNYKIGRLDLVGSEFLFTTECGIWVDLKELKQILEKMEKETEKII